MRWFLGALLLLSLGIVLQWGLLVYAMYVLLGVLLISRAFTSRWIAGVRVQRLPCAASAEIGDALNIGVRIENQGRWKVPWVLVEDAAPAQAFAAIPPSLFLEGDRALLDAVGAGASLDLEYQVTFLRRGFYAFGPTWVETGDLFGLQRRYRVLSEPHYVLVRPRVIPLEGYAIDSRRPIGEVRLAHRLFEDPTRVSGVREYQMGDSLNRVHWKATARMGTLQSKTYEPSCVAEAMLLLDFHQAGYPDRGRIPRVELAATCAASIAHALTQLSQPVGLITNGRDAADRIREEGWVAEFSTRQAARKAAHTEVVNDRLRPIVIPVQRGDEVYHQILDTLGRLELTDGMRFEAMLEETRARMPRNATLIAMLPEVTEAIAVSLADLSRQGYSVLVLQVVFDEEEAPQWADRPDWAKWLIGAGVDLRRIPDEAAVAQVCTGRLYA